MRSVYWIKLILLICAAAVTMVSITAWWSEWQEDQAQKRLTEMLTAEADYPNAEVHRANFRKSMEGKEIYSCERGLRLKVNNGRTEIWHDSKEIPVFISDKISMFLGDTNTRCFLPVTAAKNGRSYFVRQDGFVIGEPEGYQSSQGFFEVSQAVKTDDRWGIIDIDGNYIVDPVFSKIIQWGGAYRVQRLGITYWMDIRGNWIDDPTEKISRESVLICADHYKLFYENGFWGIRKRDKLIVPAEYYALHCFRDGFAWAAKSANSQLCAIGEDGNRLENMPCRDRYSLSRWEQDYPEGSDVDTVAARRELLEYASGVREERPEFLSPNTKNSTQPWGPEPELFSKEARQQINDFFVPGVAIMPHTRYWPILAALLLAAIGTYYGFLGRKY